MSTCTKKEASIMLFDRWRNRPVAPLPTDPVTGQPVARPRPVLDAIKGMLTQFVTSMGPTLMPMILEMLKNALGGMVTPSDVAAAADLAESKKLVDQLIALQGASAHTSDAADWPIIQALQQFVTAVIQSIDPKDEIPYLIELVRAAFANDPA
jgi:hypothetical protein